MSNVAQMQLNNTIAVVMTLRFMYQQTISRAELNRQFSFSNDESKIEIELKIDKGRKVSNKVFTTFK